MASHSPLATGQHGSAAYDPTSVDLSNPDSFQHGFPHRHFRYLRRECPVFLHRHHTARHMQDGGSFFVLSRHHDIRAASKDPLLFSSAQGITLHEAPAAMTEDGSDVEYGQNSMIYMDPPGHIRHRKLISTLFTPRRLEVLQPHIEELARRVVDRVAARGSCDFVLDIAAQLPLQVIAEFIGVPEQKRQVLFDSSNRMVGAEDPEYALTENSITEAAVDLYMLANELLEERRRNPQDDIITRLMNAEIDGDRLSPEEFNGFFVLLANAGNETTRNQTSHGLRLLFEHPEQREELQANLHDDEFLERAVEEMLRFSPPIIYFCRTATRDTEIRGLTIPKGQRIAMYYPSANRDEEIYTHPDRFDVRRHPNPHLAFGAGEHFCLGASLARIQLRAIFRAVLERLPNIRLAGDIRYLRSHFVDGIKNMPVEW